MLSRKHTLIMFALLLSPATPSLAQINARIADIAQFKGPRVNRLQGLGLVVGLNGTGDSGSYKRAMEPLANLLQRYANPVLDMEELKDTKNVAVVMVQAELPDGGVREGDRLDVQLSAIGECTSLEGGRLIASVLQHEALLDGTIMGFASGPLQVVDAQQPTTAVVKDGLVLEENVMVSFIASGSELQEIYDNDWIELDEKYVTIVIDAAHAGFGMAAAVAEAIKADLGIAYGDTQLAMAMDARNVVVRVPPVQVDDVVPWLRDIEVLTPLLPEQGARILIHRAKQLIIVDGEVRISPVTFSVGGLTISISRTPDGQIQQPLVEQQNFVALDPEDQAGATLNKLVQQLNQIKVPIEDRISVIEELNRMGKIHARIIYEE